VLIGSDGSSAAPRALSAAVIAGGVRSTGGFTGIGWLAGASAARAQRGSSSGNGASASVAAGATATGLGRSVVGSGPADAVFGFWLALIVIVFTVLTGNCCIAAASLICGASVAAARVCSPPIRKVVAAPPAASRATAPAKAIAGRRPRYEEVEPRFSSAAARLTGFVTLLLHAEPGQCECTLKCLVGSLSLNAKNSKNRSASIAASTPDDIIARNCGVAMPVIYRS
jgi:hypothetical protein